MIYFTWGYVLGTVGSFTHLNALLDADHSRVIGDLTDVGANHCRTDVHPLFVLMFNPVGVVIAAALGSRVLAATLINAIGGASCVVLAAAFFRRAGINRLWAVLFAAILGATSTHMFFGATPETWIFAATGVVALYFLAVARPGRLRWFLPAGVFAMGMVTPNLAHAAVTFGVGSFKKRSWKKALVFTAAYTAVIAGITSVLSALQKVLYPSSTVFFLPDVYRAEFGSYAPIVKYFPELTWTDVLSRLGEVSSYLFIYNVVAPETVVRWFSAGRFCLPLKPFVRLDPGHFGLWGLLALVLWLGLIGWAVYSCVRNREVRVPVLYGLLLSLASNLAFFFFYGSILFIYAISSTFPLIAVVALSFRPYNRTDRRTFYALSAFLICFLTVELINHMGFLYRIYTVFRDYPFAISP